MTNLLALGYSPELEARKIARVSAIACIEAADLFGHFRVGIGMRGLAFLCCLVQSIHVGRPCPPGRPVRGG